MKILVTGGQGMMGRTLYDLIENDQDNDYVFLSRQMCNLLNRQQVLNYFENNNFDYIIHLAALVGGLFKNMNQNINMFSDNIKINENVLEACHKNGIKKGIFCLSSCIYPANPSKFPMDETMIHESPPHKSNEGYSYAKRMLELQTRQYNSKYNYQYICVIPVNLYGPYDNFNLEDSHLIPGLMHRFEMTKYMKKSFEAYGTGKPLRQFLYSYDFGKIILKILFDNNTDSSPIICCNNKEYEIREVVNLLAEIMNINKDLIIWDSNKSDGCLRKTVTNEKLIRRYPDIIFSSLEDSLKETYDWFVNNFESIRK